MMILSNFETIPSDFERLSTPAGLTLGGLGAKCWPIVVHEAYCWPVLLAKPTVVLLLVCPCNLCNVFEWKVPGALLPVSELWHT